MNSTIAIRKVVIAEGGSKYTNDPKDSGGPTKYGITLKTLSEWRKRPCTAEDVKNLGEAEAIAIYKSLYWDKIGGDKLPYNVAYTLFNMAVNRGVGTAILNAQKVLGIKQDGVIGSTTLKMINANPEGFLSKFLAEMIADYKVIATNDGPNDKDQKFYKGWLNRINEISEYVKVKPAVAASGAGVVILAVIFFLIFNKSGKRIIA